MERRFRSRPRCEHPAPPSQAFGADESQVPVRPRCCSCGNPALAAGLVSMAGTSVADRFAISPLTPCRSRLREPLVWATRRSGQPCHSSRTDRNAWLATRVPTITVRRRRRLRRCRGPARRDGVAMAAVSPRAGVPGRTDASPSGVGGLRLPGLRFRPASWRGFWTPAARRVLNPHASIGIYRHEPGAGQCVVRMFMRFLAPRRRDGDCLKIVVSQVRFRASPLLLFTC
jgi:hypothetical protein